MDLLKSFKLYLESQKSQPLTIKNYLADLKNFFDWLETKTGIKQEVAGKSILGLFIPETINEYKDDQKKKGVSHTTINRRLSTLRKFGQFAKSQGWILTNPTLKINNILPREIKDFNLSPQYLLESFKKDLEKEKINPLTIKNYLVDLRHFLGWLEQEE